MGKTHISDYVQIIPLVVLRLIIHTMTQRNLDYPLKFVKI